MTPRKKLWILRLASIPALLLLPVMCMGVAVGIGERILGNSYPLGEVMLAMVVGVAAMILLSFWTVFARREGSIKRGFRVLAGIAAFDILGVPVTLLAGLLVSPRAYDRDGLKLDPIVPPAADLTGKWQGSWTDSRQDFTQTITLTLTQAQNSITGIIVDEGGTQWRIIEGVASGNQLNLFYDRDFPARPGRGATLLGEIGSNTLTGKYYGHERPRPGWASSGPWRATRAEPEKRGPETK